MARRLTTLGHTQTLELVKDLKIVVSTDDGRDYLNLKERRLQDDFGRFERMPTFSLSLEIYQNSAYFKLFDSSCNHTAIYEKMGFRFEYFFCGGKHWVVYLDNIEINCGSKTHLRAWLKREFKLTDRQYKSIPMKRVIAFRTRTSPHNQPHKPIRH